jgi:tetraacyldisaccharide 4'-kinase
MLSQNVPVVVARDRADGVALAKSQGATVILMDDGFQNPAVRKDASLIVIDSIKGIGNGKVMPAGPLRAPLTEQIARTDALLVIGDGSAADDVADRVIAAGKPVLYARFVPDEASLAALAGKRVLAFAGIGDPERFFRTLNNNGVEVGAVKVFADHHRLSQREIEQLLFEARRNALTLVTTEKDLARLRGPQGLPDWAQAIVPFAVTLVCDDAAALRTFVAGVLFKARERKHNAEN